MQERFQYNPGEVKKLATEDLREAFVITDLMEPGKLTFTYTHYDRMVVGGIVPVDRALSLITYNALKSDYFLERREMGIINIGGDGKVEVGNIFYDLNKLDCLYLGKGTQNVNFISNSSGQPAQFFILSTPAHQSHPNSLMKNNESASVALGALQTSNERTIYKYIHQDGIKSCQLVMGLTILKEGSVWNTMPAHTHNRRMEVYCYFDLPADQRVLHFMGEPQQTRHLVIANNEAVISAPWSIHSGCGTANYSFIWGMAGENQSFTDMDFIAISDLK
ncbi:MAG TPA: 5-dehydro-4-deoxy-D-glucuronate isomerase [Chitinophagaceae bacterium]|nr:5-dehydro-4-deoxy-D-glucuronate isomerase [Chitinophagaceae bacterium]